MFSCRQSKYRFSRRRERAFLNDTQDRPHCDDRPPGEIILGGHRENPVHAVLILWLR